MDCTERPEESYDHRTLYERLKEQKDRKQEEFMEQLKFSEYPVTSVIMFTHRLATL